MSCSAQNHGYTPQMTFVITETRAGELPRDVWAKIFRNLMFVKDQVSCSMTCKTWRHVISKILILHPLYNKTAYSCFKVFHSDFMKSRHIILLDSTGSMEYSTCIINGSTIVRKLIDFLEPAIKTRGIFVGTWNSNVVIKYVKRESEVESFFNGLTIWGGLEDFHQVSQSVFLKLNSLRSKLPTHVHIISDMGMVSGTTIFSHPYKTKVTFHFYQVDYPENLRFLSEIEIKSKEEVDASEPVSKKRKIKKKVDFFIHPSLAPPRNHSVTRRRMFTIPPKKAIVDSVESVATANDD
jgi:hypothetical protein